MPTSTRTPETPSGKMVNACATTGIDRASVAQPNQAAPASPVVSQARRQASAVPSAQQIRMKTAAPR
ncbi:MAG: hypothetical protein MUF60_00275 [Vicinamibacterales bacterium]|nr:hypothetical protein [Vicinamibacterales bacterium]